MADQDYKQMKDNIEILGYYLDKVTDSVFLEIKLKNLGDTEDKVVGIGLGRPLLLWMLQELDKEEESEEEVEE